MLKGNHDIVIYSKKYIHHLAHFWHRAPKIHYPAVLLALITILFLWLLKIFASQWNICKLKSPRFSFLDRKLRPLWKAFDFCSFLLECSCDAWGHGNHVVTWCEVRSISYRQQGEWEKGLGSLKRASSWQRYRVTGCPMVTITVENQLPELLLWENKLL